jgi:hypothetical protein
MLCDDKMLVSTRPLVLSVVSNTHLPMLVMVLDGVSDAARWQLQQLGAQVIPAATVPYPFAVTRKRAEVNKVRAVSTPLSSYVHSGERGCVMARALCVQMCRYSKLGLWSLTQFTRLVYLDADTLLANNADALFQHAELAAVQDGVSARAMVDAAAVIAESELLLCCVLCCAVLCCAVLCCAVLCCAVLCCAVLCCAVLRCSVPQRLQQRSDGAHTEPDDVQRHASRVQHHALVQRRRPGLLERLLQG